MDILFICENYYPHYGGAEVVFRNLAEGYVKSGHTVSIITQRLKNTPKIETLNGVNIHRVYSFDTRYLFSFLAIIKAFRAARHADIIQTTTFNGAFPAWIAAKLNHKPVIITVHEVWIGKWSQVTSFPKWKCALHDFLEHCLYTLPFDQYICVSEATQRDLLKLKIPASKSKVVYNGIDHSFWNSAQVTPQEVQTLRQELNLNSNQDWMYFAWGRPGESKGFEYLINAVKMIKQKVPRSTLVLMLSSIEKYPQKYKQLKNLITSQNLSENIKIVPPVSDQKLRIYIKAANGVVIPSLAEGFGFNVIQTNYMATPLVASDAGSIPEVISGKYLLFENKNSTDLAEKVIAIAQNKIPKSTKIKKFLWSNSIYKYLQVYQKLLPLNTGKRP